LLGEVWLASAPGPFGPWTDARKVASHDQMSFYNPVLHPEFFRADSPVIHFEGTYTTSFSGNQQPTPRWDYNQDALSGRSLPASLREGKISPPA